MIVLKIAGTDRSEYVQMGSLRITDQINSANDTCDFTTSCINPAGVVFRPTMGAEVVVESGATRIYAGVIVNVEEYRDGDRLLKYTVSCKDYTQYLDRKLVTERYEGETLQDIIVDLITRYADEYGFTSTNVQGAAVDIASVSFQDISLSNCLTKLAQLTGYMWYVDYDKDVHFFAKNEEAAPFNLDDTSANYIFESLKIKDDFSQIRNRVKVTGGEGEDEERTELLSGDGEKDIFPLATKFAELPVVEVDGAPVTVGVDFLQKDEDYEVMWSFQQKSLRFTTGNTPALPGGGDETNIAVTGIPLRPIVVVRSDTASISAYGVYEHHIINDSVKTRDEALQLALAELERYAAGIKGGSFQTYTSGLRSGQTIQISSVERGFTEQFLIQSVSFDMIGKDDYVWSVDIASAKTVSMLDILQSLLIKERISLGADESLLNFFDFSDEFTMTDALTSHAKTTTEDYDWEQGVPGSDAETNPMIWDKFTWG